jgi:hypothetical protein
VLSSGRVANFIPAGWSTDKRFRCEFGCGFESVSGISRIRLYVALPLKGNGWMALELGHNTLADPFQVIIHQ